MYSLRSVSVSVSRCATSFARFSGASWAARKGAQKANARMRPMLESPPETSRRGGSFAAAVLIGWAVLGAAGFWYARFKAIPNWATLPLLAAFLAEYPFYLALAFPAVRERFAGPHLPAY